VVVTPENPSINTVFAAIAALKFMVITGAVHACVVVIAHISPTTPLAAVAVDESCEAIITHDAVSPAGTEMLETTGVDVPVLSKLTQQTMVSPLLEFDGQ